MPRQLPALGPPLVTQASGQRLRPQSNQDGIEWQKGLYVYVFQADGCGVLAQRYCLASRALCLMTLVMDNR